LLYLYQFLFYVGEDPTLRETVEQDERLLLLAQDEGLTDMDGQEWERNTWTGVITNLLLIFIIYQFCIPWYSF
jgi:hypothetical protein